MQSRTSLLPLSPALINNLMWFLVSLVLAFFVWVLATSQLDPIEQERLPERVSVQLEPDEGLLITNSPTRSAGVIVRGQSSVLDLLTTDDIVLWADLNGLGPGTHVVELQWQVAREQVVVADTLPRQITVTLEEARERYIPVAAVVVEEPPAGFERDNPVFDVAQLEVSGAVSKVEQVVAANVELNLDNVRLPFEDDVRPVPIDADGNPVTDVTLDPQIVHVTVDVRSRADFREVRVTPGEFTGLLPDGYQMISFTYEPQTILVSGPPDVLAELPGTISTASIDLTGHTGSFEVTVPIELPNPDVFLVSGQNVTVSVEIAALTASRPFDAIPVEVIGLEDGFQATLVPDVVTVIVTGPQPLLDQLEPSNIRAAVDLNGRGEGSYQVIPVAAISGGQVSPDDIAILPVEIDVVITAAEVEPILLEVETEVTPEATAED
jgi:YbbR domain-containing protein